MEEFAQAGGAIARAFAPASRAALEAEFKALQAEIAAIKAANHGIELGLLLAGARVLARALGLDQGERLAVVAAQHIVDIADAGCVQHSRDFDLDRVGSRPRAAIDR